MIEVDKRLMLFVSQDVNKMSGLIKAIENLSESVSRFRFNNNSAGGRKSHLCKKQTLPGADTQSRLKTPL